MSPSLLSAAGFSCSCWSLSESGAAVRCCIHAHDACTAFRGRVAACYPYHPTLFELALSAHRGDKVWEQERTFSVPLSLRYPWLNWLTLTVITTRTMRT